MEKFATDNLILLEFLVDSVNLEYGVQQDIKTMDGETCVSFQFLDNSPLYVSEEDFMPNKRNYTDGCGGCSSVKNGKSCLFALSPKQAEECLSQFDIYVEVFRRMKPGCLPEKLQLGESLISIVNLFNELVEEVASASDENPVAKMLKDCFKIQNSCGELVGHISVYIRMSCFGKLIVTQFQMNLQNKSVEFKAKEGHYLFKYNKKQQQQQQQCQNLLQQQQQQQQGFNKSACPPCGPCQNASSTHIYSDSFSSYALCSGGQHMQQSQYDHYGSDPTRHYQSSQPQSNPDSCCYMPPPPKQTCFSPPPPPPCTTPYSSSSTCPLPACLRLPRTPCARSASLPPTTCCYPPPPPPCTTCTTPRTPPCASPRPSGCLPCQKSPCERPPCQKSPCMPPPCSLPPCSLPPCSLPPCSLTPCSLPTDPSEQPTCTLDSCPYIPCSARPLCKKPPPCFPYDLIPPCKRPPPNTCEDSYRSSSLQQSSQPCYVPCNPPCQPLTVCYNAATCPPCPPCPVQQTLDPCQQYQQMMMARKHRMEAPCELCGGVACSDDDNGDAQQPCVCDEDYQEIGAEMGGNSLIIRVHKDKNRIEEICDDDDDCVCENNGRRNGSRKTSYKLPKSGDCTCSDGKVPRVRSTNNGRRACIDCCPDSDAPFTFKVNGAKQNLHGSASGGRIGQRGHQKNVMLDSPNANVTPIHEKGALNDPDREVFILRVGKKKESFNTKNNLELEFCTPKGKEFKPAPKRESRDAQCEEDLNVEPPAKEPVRKGSKKGDKKKKGKK